MSDVIEMLYRLRDMAGRAADKLRVEDEAGQEVLARLDQFSQECEDGAQLLAASDLHPVWNANIPDASGLVRVQPKGNPKPDPTAKMPMPCTSYCADIPCTCPALAEEDDTVAG